MCGNVTYLGLLTGAGIEEIVEPLRLQHLESHPWASTHSDGTLNRFEPRSNSTHAAGEIPLGHQATAKHGMGKC